MKRLKKKRALVNKVRSTKTLGEADSDEEDSASYWINKSRNRQQEEIEKEKQLALDQQNKFDLQDQLINNNNNNNNSNKNNKYSSKELAGLKIAHDYDEIMEGGESVILTMADTNVLKDNNSLNEEEDTLENIKLSEKERMNKYEQMKKRKPLYNPYEQSEDGNKVLLPQYDEDDKQKKKGFTISTNGILQDENKLEEIRNKLKAGPTETPMTLEINKKVINEYMTEEEANVKFKKPKTNGATKKKKKLRKKTALEEIAEESKEVNKDHGSRDNSIKVNLEKQKQEIENEKKQKSYNRALEKAQTETKELFKKGDDKIIEEEEEEDKDLIKSLARARSNATKGNNKNEEEEISNRVIQTAKIREQQEMKQTTEKELLFTATSEFIRAVQPEELPSNIINIKNNKKTDVKEETTDDIEDHERMLKEANKRKRKSNNNNEGENKKEEEISINGDNDNMELIDNKEEEEEEVEDEGTPGIAIGGVGSMLRMLKERGKGEEEIVWAGRKTDSRPAFYDSTDPAPHIKIKYEDEHGRPMTPKEAFRALSHKFHGKKPGKNKQEKRLKQYEEEQKRLEKLNNTEAALQSVRFMQAEQEKRGSAFIVLSGGKSTSIENDTNATNNNIGKNKKIVNGTNGNNNEINSNTTNARPVGGPLQGEFEGFKLEPTKKQKLQ